MINSVTPSALFDPKSIASFSVIQIPYKFDGDPAIVPKLFVVIAHKGGYLVCVKATSNTARYDNDPLAMNGCVYYKAGEIPCFPKNTAIQPENQFPIPYAEVIAAEKKGNLKVHNLPTDFKGRLITAIDKHDTLKGQQKVRLKSLL